MISPGMLISERYEIIDKVGSGGMADVYNAKDLRLNRNVAIKILKQEYSNDAKFVAKFRAEAQSVAGLSHPNIVNVYDVGEDDNLYYIVMELVEGITLKKFIERKGRLEINEAIGIGIQIAQGIEAAHKSHIIHRDIKPQNIIISKEGKVKVTDFGIAKAATSNTITSNAMGSVHYISPEQARGGYSDEKSDIYSLGVTIYEMLSGRVPFEGESTVSVAFAHVHEAPVPLEELDAGIPRSLSRIVEKCMQKKADSRYVNAAALILDLRRAVSEPDGDYVEIEAEQPVVSSETIRITDDMRRQIKDPAGMTGRERVPERPTKKIERTRADEKEPAPEEQEEPAMDPKLERILKICSGIVALIIVVVLILCVVKFMGVLGGNKGEDSSAVPSEVPQMTEGPSVEEKKIEVPNLVGHSLEEAQEMVDELNLKIKLVSEESDEETNQVIRQSPSEGTEVEEFAVITVYYSKGKNDVVIPDVSNYTVNDAKDKLEREPFGLLISGTTSQYSDSIEKDKVMGTDPVVGSSVQKGTSVILVISKGPKEELVTVPNIAGKKEEVALELLEEKNLTPGKVSYEYSDTYTKGTVIRQTKKAGTEVEKETRVDYTVSLGSKDESTPTPKPTSPPEAEYKYIGSVTINANPFDYEGEEGMIELFLSQGGGASKRVFKGRLGYSDFPHKFSDIEGSEEGGGVITMSKDGEMMDGSWSISFRKETD